MALTNSLLYELSSNTLEKNIDLAHLALQSSAYIPRKREIIVLWLYKSFVNHTQYTLEEMSSLWKLLYEVLQEIQPEEITILMQESFLQVVIKGLQGLLQCNFNDECYLVKATQCLLEKTPPGVLFLKLCDMESMLLTVLRCYCKLAEAGSECSSVLTSVLTLLLSIVSSAWDKHPYSMKATVMHLKPLLGFMMLTLKLCEGSTVPELIHVQSHVKKVVTSGLFHRDKLKGWMTCLEAYLLNEGASLVETPVQQEHLEVITTLVDDAYESMVSRGYSPADYLPLVLPVILEGFMASNRSADVQSNVVLLAYLASALGMNSDVPFKKVVFQRFSLTEEQRLHFLNKLLEVYRRSEQYHMVMVLPQKKKGAFKPKKWFGELGGCLENLDYKNAAWFACINTTMNIAPNLVEGIMVKTLRKCWATRGLENTDIDKAQDEFLENVVLTYEKLFRIPKLLRNIFSSLSPLVKETADFLHITPGFLWKFSSSCTVMSSGQMTESWSLFIRQLSYWIVKSKESGKYMLREISGSVETFCTFLHHIQAAAPTMPASDASKVAELMLDTSKLASQMLDYSLEQQSNDCAYCALMICHAWGEVHTVLQSYRRMYEEANGRPSLAVPLEGKDLSYLHPYLTLEKVNCLLSLPDDSRKVLYVMLLLETQKIRYLFLCSEANSEAAVESSVSAATFIFSCAHLTASCKGWDQRVQGITEETFPTAVLQLLLTFSPILVPCLKAKDLVELCKCMLQILQGCQGVVGSRYTLTPCDIVKEYLASDLFRESKPMQTAFVTAVWSHASAIIGAKKRKHDTEDETQSYRSLFETLSHSAGTWHKQAETVPQMDYTSKNLVGPKDLEKLWATIYHGSQCLLGLMDCGESSEKADHKDIMFIIQVLEFLPLEDLFPGNQTRCLLGLLGILFLLSKTSRNSQLDQEKDMAVKAVCRLLTTLLDGTRRPWLLDFIDGGFLFEKVVAVFSDISLKTVDDRSLYDTFEGFLNRILRDAFRKRSTIRTLMPLVKQFKEVTPSSALKSKPFSAAAILLFSQLTMEVSKSFLHADVKSYLQKSASRLSDVLSAWLLCFLEDSNVHAMARKEAFQISALQIKYTVAASRLPTDKGYDEPCNDRVSAVIAMAASDIMALKGSTEEHSEAFSLLSVAIKHRQMLPKIPCLPVPDIWASVLFLLTNEAKMLSGNTPLAFENCLKEKQCEFFQAVFKCCSSEELKDILDKLFRFMLSDRAVSSSMKIHLKTFEVLCCGLAHSGRNYSKEIPRLLQKFVEHLSVTVTLLRVTENSDLVTCILRILGTLLGMKKPSMTHQSGAVILQVLCSLNFTGPFTDMKYFCECYQIVCRMLNMFLLHRMYLISGCASIIHSCIAMLIKSLVKVSGIDEVRRYPSEVVEQLLLSAVSLERLTATLDSHTREFGKITPFLIAEYVAESVDLTLYPPVKKTLMFVMNKLFNISSVPSNEMVLVTLPKEGTEVFKALYADSKKMSFKGKV